MSAKEMFEKLGYDLNDNLGEISYTKATCIPDRINTEYIEFRNIKFLEINGLNEVNIESYVKNALCTRTIEGTYTTNECYLSYKELQAINKQIEELGWNNVKD